MAIDERQDRLRRRAATVVIAVWVACFPIAYFVEKFPIMLAQGPMMIVMGWLYAGPLIRRDGGAE